MTAFGPRCWESGEGSEGEFSFTLDPRAADGMHIELEHNQHFETIEAFNYEW
jgi:hypothetical protein